MTFRKDINGLRAIAVIAVVLFHFNPSWVSGGFAGVDVFFVISGFLMTSIIFKGLGNQSFSVIPFYISRANRIVPALALLCFTLLILGALFLTPIAFQTLGKHTASSIGFLSNIIYWGESGYFDAASHDKWLLHTWSLSVEWQFYIIYPLVLVVLHKIMSPTKLKISLLVGCVLGFLYSCFITYQSPSFAYFQLPARAWEMMLGGVAFLYPLTLHKKIKYSFEISGLLLILSSCFYITEENHWPGYLALLPVFGTFLVIQAQQSNSIFTGNILFQKIGTWSYSIYLWHWPLVVSIYMFSLSELWTYIGILLSIFLGFISYQFIEKRKFKVSPSLIQGVLTYKPLYMILFVGGLGSFVYVTHGTYSKAGLDQVLNTISTMIQPSPYRNTCHRDPLKNILPETCEYFGEKITWATIGDSHTVELAYALAEKLRISNQGLAQYSFSACPPSYNQDNEFSHCTEWTNETISTVINNNDIKNVLINYRYSFHLFGESRTEFPNIPKGELIGDVKRKKMLNALTSTIKELSKAGKNVYIFKPVPEMGRSIYAILGQQYLIDKIYDQVISVSREYYDRRNNFILSYFDDLVLPKNVTIIDPNHLYCLEDNCFAVLNGIPLYFDYDHPSVSGASLLINEIENQSEHKAFTLNNE